MESKNQIEKFLIEDWGKIFTMFPELNKLPIYCYGRYYKYECAGDAFDSECSTPDELIDLYNLDKSLFQVDLINTICDAIREELTDGNTFTYYPDRKDVQYHYGDTTRGGKCLCISRNGSELSVTVTQCDSPE